MATEVYLFVYGTLRRALGQPMARLLEPARFVADGVVAGRLYDLGRYPGMVPPRGSQDRVRGEVHRLLKPKLTLRRLDEYEGCRPYAAAAEYARTRVTVRLDDGRALSAWGYRYNGDLGDAEFIVGGDYVQAARRGRRALRGGR